MPFRLFGRSRGEPAAGIRPAAGRWPPDATLLQLSPWDGWTMRDSFEGCQVFGAVGAGKTSGSGAALANAFLRAGYGGLVLTVKVEEREDWVRHCRAAGREDRLIVVRPGGAHRFNPLDYEYSRTGPGGGLTSNLVSLFLSAMSSGGDGAGNGDAFWSQALTQLLRETIDLAALGTGRVSLTDLAKIIRSAAQSPAEAASDQWQADSFCARLLREAGRRDLTPPQRGDLDQVADYWLLEFPGLAEKTRSIIVSSFTARATAMLRSPIRELFSADTSFTPELMAEGRIILLDLPVHEYGAVGAFVQTLFKTCAQRWIERRDLARSDRPVFLFADEAQHFISREDLKFAQTARSRRCATVLMTQCVSNYIAALGGRDAEAVTDGLLAVLGTKIFHANGDVKTNQLGESIFAKAWGNRTSVSAAQGRDGTSVSQSESLDSSVLAGEFTTLRKGGPHKLVDAVIFQSGRTWNATGTNCLRTTFRQR